jgi:hypothetical protein
MTRLGNGGVMDADLFDPLLALSRMEAAVGRDQSRRAAKHLNMALDCRRPLSVGYRIGASTTVVSIRIL